MALPTDVALKLAALLAALTAITVEDLAAIKSIDTLGPVVADNVASLQATAQQFDKETIDVLNAERGAAGLPAL
jgi:uncharacterized protein YkwD